MNNLKNTRCYLAGAIENDINLGRGWRDQIKDDLSEYGIQWMDPSRKPIAFGSETPETAAALKALRSDHKAVKVTEAMSHIRAIDLRMVTISDWLIAKVNPNVPTFGTHEELALTVSQHKPIFVLIEGGIDAAPLWWFDMLPEGSMFYSLDDMYARIWQANSGQKKLVTELSNYKWMFFDWMGDNGK